MAGTTFAPATFRPSPSGFGGPIQNTPIVPSTITINWAGLSVGTSSDQGNVAIGRNLAYSQLFRDTAAGGTQRVQIGTLSQGEPGFNSSLTDQGRAIFTAVGVNNSVALATVSNNAAGFVSSLPTELMLAPGQTFSAVCGVHNIVVIPENG